MRCSSFVGFQRSERLKVQPLAGRIRRYHDLDLVLGNQPHQRLTFDPNAFALLIQLASPSASNVATVVRNAAVLEMLGAELEVMFQISSAWNVRASYGYLDAE